MTSDTEMDDYEIMCQKNIEERNKFMKCFFTDIKKDTEKIQDLEEKRKELKKRTIKEKPKISESELRTSKRIKLLEEKKDIFVAEKIYFLNLHSEIEEKREKTAESILTFDFNETRARNLSVVVEPTDNSRGIVYWMFRDVRVQDNWALLYAQKIALQKKIPLHVCFCLVPNYLDATLRYYEFLLDGLEEVALDLKSLNINFHLLFGEPTNVLVDFVNENQMGALICDFLPLKLHSSWVEEIREKLPKSCPFFQVDAHNVVPCWEISNILQFSSLSSTLSIIDQYFDEYLTEYPPVVKHPFKTSLKFPKNKWKAVMNFLQADKTVKGLKLIAGYRNAINELEKFIKNDLETYFEEQNNFFNDTIVNLGPWLNYGMISVQRVIITLREFEKLYEKSVNTYIRQFLMYKSCCDLFCYYNPDYDNLDGAKDFVKETLIKHSSDPREYIYTLSNFENAETHDNLWNAAQNQLVEDGFMHSDLMKYWAKRIFEWTNSPKEAIEYAIYLHNKYSIEGHDPTGYVGCMIICGIYGYCAPERPVFGKTQAFDKGSYFKSTKKYLLPYINKYAKKRKHYKF